jgi:hypothetical protein
MGALSGYLALGVAVRNEVFIEASGYVRPAFDSSPDTHQTLQRIHGVTGFEVGDEIVYGAVFDAETAGHCLCHWSWSPTKIWLPGTFPQSDVITLFAHPVQLAINATSATGGMGLEIGRGSTIGSMNGNPMTAGVRLVVVVGKLVARAMVPTTKRAAA